MSEPHLPFQSARPSIEIAGKRDATLTSALLNLHVVDSNDGMARCELTFGNWGGPEKPGFQHFGRDKLEFGKAVKVTLGASTLFEGRISAITAKFPEGGPPQVGVCAEDRLQDLRMTRRTRTFADASLADVIRKIAGDHGLQPQVDAGGETYKLLAQVNQSDLAFARDLGRREDVQVWVEGTKLNAAQRARRQGGTVELTWAGNLRDFSVSADLAHQRTKLVGAGWNVADKQASKHEADEAAIRAELNGGDSGAGTLKSAFGERADTLAHQVPASDAQARALADASFRHLSRRFVVGRGVAETKPELRVGAKLKIKGLGPLFEGEYTVTDTSVRFDNALGLRTEFLCDRPSIGKAS
ncbi:MAG TPA: contractile injection system protein, VgrG/Pvc8 family [Thermoanaerobaculia bacterium]|nr:contractile injection system protein, VgrG/Pvc8 family [Thermoanaerobaculia bacterium]